MIMQELGVATDGESEHVVAGARPLKDVQTESDLWCFPPCIGPFPNRYLADAIIRRDDARSRQLQSQQTSPKLND